MPATSPNEPSFGPPAYCSDWYLQEGAEYRGHAGRWEFHCLWGAWEDDFYIEEYFWHDDTGQIRLSAWVAGSGWMPWASCRLNDDGAGQCDA